MKKILSLVLFSFFFISCGDETTTEIPPEIKEATISGTLEITNQKIINDFNLTKTNWAFDENSEVEIKISKNLTSFPYNLRLDLKVDANDANSPTISFISDFERKILPGNRYRLIATAIFFDSVTFIPGSTGGQAKFFNIPTAYGFSIGSELEITIANTGSTLAGGNGSQRLILSGNFPEDQNQGAGNIVGVFNITIEGDNLVDLTVF